MAGVQLDGGEDGVTGGGSGGGSDGSGGDGGVGGGSDGSDDVVAGVGNGGDLGGPPGAADHTVTKVVGDVGDAVVPGLVDVGVAASDAVAVGSAALLGGVVDVLVAVGGVAGLVLGSVLAAGHLGGDGGNGSDRGDRSNRGSDSRSNSKWSSSVVGGRSDGMVSSGGNSSVSSGMVTKTGVTQRVLGGGCGQGGGQESLQVKQFCFHKEFQKLTLSLTF